MIPVVVFLTCSVGRRLLFFFFFQAEDGIRDVAVTGVQTCALPICDRGPVRRGPDVLGCAGGSAATLRPPPPRGGRSGERRVGEEGRSRWAPYHLKKKKKYDESGVEERECREMNHE